MKKKTVKKTVKEPVKETSSPLDANTRIWYEKKASGKRTGRTFAVVKEKNCFAVGISRCSKNDPFNRKIGRTIAAGRAKKVLGKYGAADVAICDSNAELMAFVVPPKMLDALYTGDSPFSARLKLMPKWLFEERRNP